MLLWLWGAPSHLDTFDPKPNAPAEYRGPFGTIATRNPGIRFTELFPRMAARSHRFTLIRSNKNFHSDHLEGGTIALTGMTDAGAGCGAELRLGHRRPASRCPRPASVHGRGPRQSARRCRPHEGLWRRQLGQNLRPFPRRLLSRRRHRHSRPEIARRTDAAHQDRRRLLHELDGLRRQVDNADLQKWDATSRRAYALLTSPDARQALDLSRESEKTREAYGQTSFGQSCLLARRLVEARVPYVQVNWSQYVEVMIPNCDFGWDTHVFNFELLADWHGPVLDRVFSALLDDLQDRGLLEDTLVVCMGEFGRTPRINGQASRDHWPNCYFSIWAGAGIPSRPGHRRKR